MSRLSSIEANDGLSLTVSESANAVSVKSDIAVLRQLQVRMEGSTLHLFFPDRTAGNYSTEITIPAYSLDSVSLSGGSSLNSNYPYQLESVSFTLSGGSECSVPVTCTMAKVNLSGGSVINYSGNAGTSGCTTSGGSKVVHE